MNFLVNKWPELDSDRHYPILPYHYQFPGGKKVTLSKKRKQKKNPRHNNHDEN